MTNLLYTVEKWLLKGFLYIYNVYTTKESYVFYNIHVLYKSINWPVGKSTDKTFIAENKHLSDQNAIS